MSGEATGEMEHSSAPDNAGVLAAHYPTGPFPQPAHWSGLNVIREWAVICTCGQVIVEPSDAKAKLAWAEHVAAP